MPTLSNFKKLSPQTIVSLQGALFVAGVLLGTAAEIRAEEKHPERFVQPKTEISAPLQDKAEARKTPDCDFVLLVMQTLEPSVRCKKDNKPFDFYSPGGETQCWSETLRCDDPNSAEMYGVVYGPCVVCNEYNEGIR